jgi:hypothetical protein
MVPHLTPTIPRKPTPSPEQRLHEAEQELLVVRGRIRSAINERATTLRARKAEEYLYACQALVNAFIQLSAADELVSRCGGSLRLQPQWFHCKLVLPFPGSPGHLLPPLIRPYQNDLGYFTDPIASGDYAAQTPFIEKARIELESSLRKEFDGSGGGWPFP